ncbi:OmpW/AlkL family protein [Robbsia andropogonis]|uniref:OmpW/AlkL family protein n=2 Tax=Robbsia andropogonis TaxID=28092 RepID=UPI000698B5CD|nr:OmpW family outer membrane protein [Robbsia andropogonis]
MMRKEHALTRSHARHENVHDSLPSCADVTEQQGRQRPTGRTTARTRTRLIGSVAIGATLIVGALQQAQAQKAGDLIIGTGWLHVAPQVSTGPMNTNGNLATPLGPMPFSRSDGAATAGVSAANTIGLTATYFITDHIAAETVAGLPPKFNINGTGTNTPFGKIGSARMWSPTLLLKYYFRQPTAKLRPFIGVGVTYVWFTGAQITNGEFSRTKLYGDTSVHASRGFAPVFNAGLSYNVDKNWFVGASISYIPLASTLTMNTPNMRNVPTPSGARVSGSSTTTVRARLNPIVTYVNIGYRF